MKIANSPIRILFVDDQEAIRRLFRAGLRATHIDLETAVNGEEALALLRERSFDLVITDVRMPVMDGITLLKSIKERYPSLFVVILTAHGSIEDAVKALKCGAYDYILKPFDFSAIRRLIAMVGEHRSLLGVDGECAERPFCFENIIGNDARMFEVFHRIKTVSASMATVLLTGESGTGKELVARAIHTRGSRWEKPFVAVNCGTFTDSVMHSELFGHEKGAFTGANQQRSGHFEIASGGTIFLDEIADTSPELQKSLLRLLESGTFYRVGGNCEQKTTARVIAASNKDLIEEVTAGRFRMDLFYRLNVVSLEIPPLRERKGDIPLLLASLIHRLAKEENRRMVPCASDTLRILLDHDWPGNVRELVNVVRNALLFCDTDKIQPCHLPRYLSQGTGHSASSLYSGTLAEAEKNALRYALEYGGGNMSITAARLGISRGTLYSKLDKHGISRPEKS
jgi:DNA-binding NtrC family response regulator